MIYVLQSAINAVRLLREANKEVTAGQSLLDLAVRFLRYEIENGLRAV